MNGEQTATGSGTAGTGKSQSEWFCNWAREGAERIADILTPPEAAGRHFREARIEFLRGMRELIDHRIDRLSKDPKAKGTRVTVD